jgi:hypothetical protein
MVQAYEANKDPNKIVTLLKAVQWTRVAWEQMVIQKTIQKCWWRSIVIKKPIVEGEVIEEDNSAAERAELQAQIASLLIKDPLSLNEFLNPESETILDEDSDIFALVVEHYSVDKEGDESYESDIEEVEKVPTTEALRCLEIVKL